MVLVDSIVIFGLFCLGRVALNRNERLNEIADQGDIRKMKAKYHIWIISTVFRICIFIPRISNLDNLGLKFTDCVCTDTANLFPFLLVFMEAIPMDFVSACIVLGMYWVPKQQS